MGEEKYPVEDYWGEFELELISDKTKNWEYKEFIPTSGYWIKRDGQNLLGKINNNTVIPKDAVIEENVWDHEHCELCGAKIMNNDECFRNGYTDGYYWICPDCFPKYVLPRIK